MRFTHISAKHNLFDLKLNEVWQYRDLIFLFTRRNFATLYKQTILGPLWLFVNPLMTAIINMVVFGSIAKLGTDGIPQLLFYMSGNAGLFGKVYFPRLTVPLSNILSNGIRFGIQMILVMAVLLYYVVTGRIHIYPVRDG